MTAMLPSHQAYACPLPHAVHDFYFTPCLMHTPYARLSLRLHLLFYSATTVWLHHVFLPFLGYA